MTNKRLIAVLVALVLSVTACLTACNKEDTTGTERVSTTEGEARKSSNTAILVVSFGTSYNDSREKTIGAIENAIATAYPQYDVRRAFTSQTIIDKLKEEENLSVDNVEEALDRAISDGIKNLVVQPTHLLKGLEYNELKEELENYKDQFTSIKLGAPLLSSEEDYANVIAAVTEATKQYDDGSTAIALFGHGSESTANSVYSILQEKLTEEGYRHYVVGTVEAEPSIEDVVRFVDNGSYDKVVLVPLMVVAGDHATNDMAGDDSDSWKSRLEREGYEVETVMEGLGQNAAIRQIYVQHVAAATALE